MLSSKCLIQPVQEIFLRLVAKNKEALVISTPSAKLRINSGRNLS